MRLPRPPHLFATNEEQPSSPSHRRLNALESEVRSLRPSRAPSEAPAPIPIVASHRVLLCLSEMALHQVAIGELEEARRTVGDAVLVLEQVKDETTIARACVLLGEALLALDRPMHARPRFALALDVFERQNDARWRLRARVGLGRALVALDDVFGVTVLGMAREECRDPALAQQIDKAIEQAAKIFDTPRTVRTGYGRPVTVHPPPRNTR